MGIMKHYYHTNHPQFDLNEEKCPILWPNHTLNVQRIHTHVLEGGNFERPGEYETPKIEHPGATQYTYVDVGAFKMLKNAKNSCLNAYFFCLSALLTLWVEKVFTTVLSVPNRLNTANIVR